MKKNIVFSIVILCLFVIIESASAQEIKKAIPVYDSQPVTASGQVKVSNQAPLTALDVIEMSRAGFGDDVIISKIDVSGAVFDLSVGDMIELKKAGVSDQVINHMINTKGIQPAKPVSTSIPKAVPVTYTAPAPVYYATPAPAYYVYDYYEPWPVSIGFSWYSYRCGPWPYYRRYYRRYW